MSTMKVNRIENTSTASGGLNIDASGKVRITTLADSAGNSNSSPAEITSGRAKAWVNFNGQGTVAIRNSYNVASITDNGTGDYTINFATNMPNSTYVPLVMNIARTNQTAGNSPPGVRSVGNLESPNASLTVSGVRIIHRPTSNNTDANMYGVAVFGD